MSEHGARRVFRRNPGFAIVAILSLTLGIGATTALFAVIAAVRLRPLPITDPGGLYEIRLASMEGSRGNFESGYPTVTQPIWRDFSFAVESAESRREARIAMMATTTSSSISVKPDR